MIVKEEVSVQNNFPSQQKFTIKACAQGFRLISKGLYSDPWTSTLRELVNNGRDSHAEAGCSERPVQVTLPTSLQTNLVIRDFGTGMSNEFMMEKYTQVFNSTRNTDNQFIGAFGLGRLSAFSVSDSYVVKCFDGKTCRTYSCFIGEDGPVLSAPMIFDSKEERGVEVSIHVGRDNHYRLVEAAKNVFKYFPVKPIIRGAIITFPEINSLIKGKDWYAIKADYYGNRTTLIMGGVAYNASVIINNDLEIVINCNVGDFSVTASREELEKNAHTNKFIESTVDRVKKELHEEFSKQVADCKCVYDAWKKCSELSIWGATYKGIDLQSYRFSRPDLIVYKVRGSSKKLEYPDTYICPRYNSGEYFEYTETGLGRLRQHVRNGNQCWLVKFATDQDKADFESDFGMKVRKAEDLPKVVSGPRSKSAPPQYLAFTGNYTFRSAWKKMEKAPTTGCYVELKGCEPIGFGNHGDFVSVVKQAQKLGFTEEIYGVRSKSLSTVNLPSLTDKLKELIKKNSDLEKYGRPYDYNNYKHLGRHVKLFPNLKELVDRTNFALSNQNRIQAYNSLVYSLEKRQIEVDVSGEVDKMLADKPLVKFLLDKCGSYLDELKPEWLESYLKS